MTLCQGLPSAQKEIVREGNLNTERLKCLARIISSPIRWSQLKSDIHRDHPNRSLHENLSSLWRQTRQERLAALIACNFWCGACQPLDVLCASWMAKQANHAKRTSRAPVFKDRPSHEESYTRSRWRPDQSPETFLYPFWTKLLSADEPWSRQSISIVDSVKWISA